MKKSSRLWFGAIGVAIVLFSFQNCGVALNAKKWVNSSSDSDGLFPATTDICQNSPSQDCALIQTTYREVLMREPGRDEVQEWQSQINSGQVKLSDLNTTLSNLPEARALMSIPSQRKIEWGPWVLAVSDRNTPLHPLKNFNAMAGKPASLAGFNTWWHTSAPWGDFNNTVRDWMNGVRSQGATPVILWNPTDVTAGKKCTDADFVAHLKNFTPRAVLAGTHDNYIRRWARQARDWGHPFHLRVFHENNARTVTNDPCTVITKVWDAEVVLNGEQITTKGESSQAWKHVVNIFRQEGATNVKFMWTVLSWPSINFGGNNPIAMKDIYPGDDYVDSIGIECYAFRRTNLESCEDLMRISYSEAAALSPTKPITNIEMGAFASTEKAQWIYEALNLNHPRNTFQLFPRLTAFMYWDDSRTVEGLHALWVKSDANSPVAFRAAVAHPDYVAGGNGGSDYTRQGCVSQDGSNLGHGGVMFFFDTPISSQCDRQRMAIACVDGQLVTTANAARDKKFKYTQCKASGALDSVQARMVVVDAYQSIIGRSEQETITDAAGIAHFVNKLTQGVSIEQIQNEMRGSDEAFVRQQYISIMGRTADAPGLAYYLNQLKTGAKTRQQIIEDLRFALPRESGTQITEAQARQVVTDLFVNVMGRTLAEVQADPAGVDYYVQQYRSGAKTTGQIRNDLLASDEYFLRQQYISILGRRADLPGLRSFMSLLSSGAKTRQQIIDDLRFFCANKIGGECT